MCLKNIHNLRAKSKGNRLYLGKQQTIITDMSLFGQSTPESYENGIFHNQITYPHIDKKKFIRISKHEKKRNYLF